VVRGVQRRWLRPSAPARAASVGASVSVGGQRPRPACQLGARPRLPRLELSRARALAVSASALCAPLSPAPAQPRGAQTAAPAVLAVAPRARGPPACRTRHAIGIAQPLARSTMPRSVTETDTTPATTTRSLGGSVCRWASHSARARAGVSGLVPPVCIDKRRVMTRTKLPDSAGGRGGGVIGRGS
jgi:hypothetical protein